MRPLVGLALLAACGFQAPSLPDPDLAPDGPPAGGVDAESLVPGDGAASMSARAFVTQLVTDECDLAFGCKAQYPASKHPTFDDEWGTSVTQCVSWDDDIKALPRIEAAIASGSITWNLAEALACLSAPGIPTSCSTLFDESYSYASACFAALQGHVADGGTCTTGWECQSLSSDCRQGKCTP